MSSGRPGGAPRHASGAAAVDARPGGPAAARVAPTASPAEPSLAPLAAAVHVDDDARKIVHLGRGKHGGERGDFLGGLDASERKLVGPERLLPAAFVAEARLGALLDS